MKNKKPLILAVAVFILVACVKETTKIANFEKRIGGTSDEVANSIIYAHNALYVLGTTKSGQNSMGDSYLLKFDLLGNLLYEKTFGGAAFEQGIDLVATRDGNLVLVGTTASLGAGSDDVHLLKVKPNGALLWEKTFGGAASDDPASIIETANGDLCIIGTTYSFGAGDRDIYLIRTTANGDVIYEKTFGGIEQDGGTEIRELDNGELLILAYTHNFGATSRDFYLMKTNSQGDIIWSYRYGTPEYEEPQAMAIDKENNYILFGHSAGTDPHHDMYAVKVDANGQSLWTKEFGGMMHDGGEAMLIDSDGNYVFIGRTMSYGAGGEDAYFVKTNAAGELLEEVFIGGVHEDRIDELVEVDDAYYMVGYSNSASNGGLDVFLVRLNIEH